MDKNEKLQRIDIDENKELKIMAMDKSMNITTSASKSVTQVDCNNQAIGECSHAEGNSTTANGYASHSEGYSTLAYGFASHSEGLASSAYGNLAHAEGLNSYAIQTASHSEGQICIANGENSHAEGLYTTANGNASHAEGQSCIANNENSHAEGFGTNANGNSSHSEGRATNANGYASHSEGWYTTASGFDAHAEGDNCIASGENSHAEGGYTTASAFDSHAEGQGCEANGQNSHAEGLGTFANGNSSHTEGWATIADGEKTHAEGQFTLAVNGSLYKITGFNDTAKTITLNSFSGLEVGDSLLIKIKNNPETPIVNITGFEEFGIVDLDTTATINSDWSYAIKKSDSHFACHVEGVNTVSGNASHAEGWYTAANKMGAHAEGYECVAFGENSHAEGLGTNAMANASHTEGWATHTYGDYAHAEGYNTLASRNAAHAEGYECVANGEHSHAEGLGTNAMANSSHTEGWATTTNGDQSHAEGWATTANGYQTHIMGRFGDGNDNYSWFLANGNGNDARGLAAKILWNGTGYADNGWYGGGADYAEMFETSDGQPIDVGYFITLENDKIRKANSSDDYILGITTANSSFVGDSGELRWKNKFMMDEWGRIQYHDVVIPEVKDKDINVVVPAHVEKQPILNPEWDNTREYIPRLKRPEWVTVGLMGKLLLRDDGTCLEGGYCKSNEKGIATASNEGYRVMKRTGPNQILVFIK